jgi:hypothetical protein
VSRGRRWERASPLVGAAPPARLTAAGRVLSCKLPSGPKTGCCHVRDDDVHSLSPLRIPFASRRSQLRALQLAAPPGQLSPGRAVGGGAGGVSGGGESAPEALSDFLALPSVGMDCSAPIPACSHRTVRCTVPVQIDPSCSALDHVVCWLPPRGRRGESRRSGGTPARSCRPIRGLPIGSIGH